MKRIAATVFAGLALLAAVAPAADAATGSGDVCNGRTVILFVPIC